MEKDNDEDFLRIRCEKCEKGKFKLWLTENLNVRVICSSCGTPFVLRLDDSTKRLITQWNSEEME